MQEVPRAEETLPLKKKVARTMRHGQITQGRVSDCVTVLWDSGLKLCRARKAIPV